MSGAYVYLLQCADGAYYAGITHRTPDERESEHNLGLDPNAWNFGADRSGWCGTNTSSARTKRSRPSDASRAGRAQKSRH